MTDRRFTSGDQPGETGAASARAVTFLMDGRYRIERTIGEGAFGRVYLAFDTRLRRNVAVKELLASRNMANADAYAHYLERFKREARAAGVVQHPNIVAVLELAIDGTDNHYLVMEYIDGINLRDLIAQVGTLPLERAVQIGLDVARALEAVHEQDIVHRDLKPANIMLTRRGVTKVTDFGVAQVGHESMRTQIAGGHPGTPLYMSPEQGSGHGYLDGRSDLYSLGLILFEMLVGEPYTRRPRSLAAARPDTSPDLVAIFERLTAKERNDRFSDAGAVVTALSGLSHAPAARAPLENFTLPAGGPAFPVSGGAVSRSSGSAWASGPPASASSARSWEGSQAAGSGEAGSDARRSRSSVDVTPSVNAVPAPAPAARRPRGLLLAVGGAVMGIGIVVAVLVVALAGRTGGGPGQRTDGATLSSPAGASRTPPTAVPPPATVVPAASAAPPASTAPTVPATPAGAGSADFAQWATTEVAGLYRRSFDPGSGEYHVTLLKENTIQPIFAPETQRLADLSLEVDIRRVAGPDAGGYGIAFRVQPLNPGDKVRAAYIFVIDGRQRYALYELHADGSSVYIQPFTPLPPGAMNTVPNAADHLKATCRGDQITLALNGATLNSYTATITSPGTVGIAMETPANTSGVEAAFRNLHVSAA